jgi:hypothetical protein
MDDLAIGLVHGWQSEAARKVSAVPQEETCPKDSDEALKGEVEESAAVTYVALSPIRKFLISSLTA